MAGNLVDFGNYSKASLDSVPVEQLDITIGGSTKVTVSALAFRWGRFIEVDAEIVASASDNLVPIISGLPAPMTRIDIYINTVGTSTQSEVWIGDQSAPGVLYCNAKAGTCKIHLLYLCDEI